MQKLVASDGAANDRFGSAVSLDGSILAVGVLGDDADEGSIATICSVYVYVTDDNGETWILRQKLTASDGTADDYFGVSVAVHNCTIVVGARKDDNEKGTNAGSVYVFCTHDNGVTWSQKQKLLVSDGAAGDGFGILVAVHGDTIVAGAVWDDNAKGEETGAAYVYGTSAGGTMWSQKQKLLASDQTAYDYFGRCVAIYGETIVVASDYDDNEKGTDAGAVYLFVTYDSGGTWSQTQKLVASDGSGGAWFGHYVAIHNCTIVVGAWYGSNQNGINAGSVYVFVTHDTRGTWSQMQRLAASDGGAGDGFGWSVAVHGNTVAVGAWNEDENGANAGSAYRYVNYDGGLTWSEEQKLVASDGGTGDQFGFVIAVGVQTIVVGAYQDDN
ncbi:unnamed protein product, partial [Ectocarpus fasciculatus]